MDFKCRIGFHSWEGCTCSGCYKTRNEQHNWLGCKCSKCGTIRDEHHDWSQDCEKCLKCGRTRENKHEMSQNAYKCSKCGKNEQDINNAEAFCNRGNEKLERDDYQGAITEYTKAIKIDPNYAPAYLARGTAKLKVSDSSAMQDIEIAIRFDPEAVKKATMKLNKKKCY